MNGVVALIYAGSSIGAAVCLVCCIWSMWTGGDHVGLLLGLAVAGAMIAYLCMVIAAPNVL